MADTATAPPATTPAPTPTAAPAVEKPAAPATPAPATPTAPATPAVEKPTETIAQTVEKAALTTATEIATSILKSTTPDLKSLENSVAKETLINDNDKNNDGIADSTFLEKVEGAAQIVAGEVVKGAQNVVKAVEEHPELLAEGALAVAVGAASLIQPELLAGEVAIIGKMGDSAKATLTKIAQEEGTKVVQAISKDAAASAKVVEESAVKVDDSAKKVEDSAAKVQDSAVKVEESAKKVEKASAESTTGEKVVEKEGLSKADATALGSAIAKNVSKDAKEDQVVTLDLDRDGEGPQAPITLKITVGADGQVKGLAQTSVDGEEAKKVEGSEVKTEEPKNEETKVESVPKLAEQSQAVKSAPTEIIAPTTETSKASESKERSTDEAEAAKVEASLPAVDDKATALNIEIDGKGDVSSVKETPVEVTPASVEASKPKAVESDNSKPEEANSEEVNRSTKKDIPQTAEPSHVHPHLENANSVAPSKEIPVKDSTSQATVTENIKVEDIQKSAPQTKEDIPSAPSPATDNSVSKEPASETAIDTPDKPETSALPETKVEAFEPAPTSNETASPKAQEAKPALKESSEVAAASLIGAAAVTRIEKLESKDDTSPGHVEDISPTVETEKLVVSEKKDLEPESIKESSTKEESPIKDKEAEATRADEPVSKAIVEAEPSTGGKSSNPQTEKISKQEPIIEPLSVKKSATDAEQETPPTSSSVEEDDVPSIREDKNSELEPVTAIKPVEKIPAGVATESPAVIESKTPVSEEKSALVNEKVEKSVLEEEPESNKKPTIVEPAKEIAAPIEAKKSVIEDESIPLIEQEKEAAPASESTSSPKNAQPEEGKSTINGLAPHVGTAIDAENPIPVVEKSVDEIKPQDEPVANEAVDKPEAAIHEEAKTESPVVSEDTQTKEISDKAAVESTTPESIPDPESSREEEVAKEKIPERPVESIEPEPVHVDVSASAAQEPETSIQAKQTEPEQVVSKPMEKLSQEPEQKDVPAPLAVEHVSQPAMPLTQKIEPESPSSNTKAAEIVTPAIIAAAAAKAVAPITEWPSSPTKEDIANIHTSMQSASKSTLEPVSDVHPELDNINEQLQLLTKTLSQQSAHRVTESISKVIEPVVSKEVEPVVAEAPEPVVPSSSEPDTTSKADEKPSVHESRPMTVTIKSVETVKASSSAQESKVDDRQSPEDSKTSAQTPEIKPDDKKTAETPKVIDASSSATDTPTESSQPATPTNKPTHVKRRSVWGYLWPFGGAAKPVEQGTDNAVDTPKPSETPNQSESPEVVPEIAHVGAA